MHTQKVLALLSHKHTYSVHMVWYGMVVQKVGIAGKRDFIVLDLLLLLLLMRILLLLYFCRRCIWIWIWENWFYDISVCLRAFSILNLNFCPQWYEKFIFPYQYEYILFNIQLKFQIFWNDCNLCVNWVLFPFSFSKLFLASGFWVRVIQRSSILIKQDIFGTQSRQSFQLKC